MVTAGPPGQPPAAPAQVSWSIAEVERDTGLGKDTLRVWERRYGFPVPGRDRQGERSYPQDQVQRLRVIKRLLDAGHRPGKVVPLTLAQLEALVSTMQAHRGPSPQDPAQADWLQDPAMPWLVWLAEDRTDLIKQALQQQILRRGLGPTVQELVAPLCVHVGEAWLRGDLSIYQEHLLTETLQSVLREAISSVDASGQTLQQPPRVLLATTSTEQHGLGLLMAECFFALESCARYVLGVSTPVADIVEAGRQLRVDVVALSFSAHASRREVIESLQQLVTQLPAPVEIWAGGAAAALYSRSLPESVQVVRKAMDVPRLVQAWRQRQAPPAGEEQAKAP